MAARGRPGSAWRSVLIYGGLLALGGLTLQWLNYQRFALAHAGDVYIALIAVGFLALGLVIGARVVGRPAAPAIFDGNPKAQAALGLSSREMDVLVELAAGRSNKEIAARLSVSPNTVKTHVARLLEKLQAGRRTEAIARARALGLIP